MSFKTIVTECRDILDPELTLSQQMMMLQGKGNRPALTKMLAEFMLGETLQDVVMYNCIYMIYFGLVFGIIYKSVSN